MAYLIKLNNFTDSRGNLTVLDDVEKLLPFSIKRFFYIYKVDDSLRGGHRHRTTQQAVICINGSCAVTNNNGEEKEIFLLDDPSKCLILETRDWHQMHSFSKDAILIVFASTTFDSSDYIFEPYPNKA